MRLYEIRDEIELVMNQEVGEGGEVTDETLARLDALELEEKEKALAIACYAKGELAEGEACIAEAKKLRERGQVHINRANRLKRYLNETLPPGTKYEDSRARIRWRKSTAVVLEPDAELPDPLVRVKREANRTAIKEALERGGHVPGAHLETRQNLVID